ncbi:MAG: PAS domain S-box protein [Alphaproteobacteria bacterium]
MATTSANGGAIDLEAILDRLSRDGESIVIERDGRPVAMLAAVDDIATRRNPARSGPTAREAGDDPEARPAARTEDLTETNRALRARAAQLRQAHQITRLGHWSWYPEADRLTVSPEMAEILGVAPKEFDGITNKAFIERFVHPDDRERVRMYCRSRSDAVGRYTIEYRLCHSGDSEYWVHELSEVIVDEAGERIGEVGTIQDITDRKRDETALRESEERFRGIFEQGSVGVAVMRPDGHFIQVNQAYSNFIGYRAEELVGQYFKMVIHPDDLPGVSARYDAIMAGGAIVKVDERRYLHKSGSVLWGLAGLTMLRDPDGGVSSYMVQVQDITERKRAERALHESEERLRDFAEATSDWVWEMDADLRFMHLSDRAAVVLGLDPLEVIGKTRWEFAGAGREDGKWRRHNADLLARVPFRDFRYERAGVDGKRQCFTISGKPVFDERGDFKGYRGTGTDITAEVEAQSRTEEVRAQFFDAIENSTEAIALFDKDDRLILYNSHYGETVGRVVPGLLQPGVPFEQIVREGASKGLYDEAEKDIERMVAQRIEDHHNLPMMRQHRLGDGSWVQVREQRTSDGGVILLQDDVTELRESEARLRQAQKMEAVGQLTGGVAHDFNNLLGVIMGNAEIMADRVGVTDPQLNAILRATRRGAELTDRLLAFSRRQALAPKSIDLDELILGMTELLARTLGETILITASKTPGLWCAVADPGQLENALINLAINARDAMPGGGKLVVETVNFPLRDRSVAETHGVSTGDYVSLLVADNGHGMTPEVLARAADPFFTTKGVGQGSGLGLSMVEGFARQSGGFMTIESSPGAGAMVKVVLPRAEKDSERPTSDKKAKEPRARGETILVVEDDPDVRALAVSILKRLSYRVVEAQDGRAALEVLREPEPIDLILTDVVLPGGLSGPEMVTQSRGWRPGVRALFMSGYATDDLNDQDRLDAASELLSKPFRRAELAERVRSALDRPGSV